MKSGAIPGYPEFPCVMKNERNNSHGVRVQKRQSTEDLSSIFHKKLRISEEDKKFGHDIISGSNTSPASTALILYQEPAARTNDEQAFTNMVKKLTAWSSFLLDEPIIVPKNHLDDDFVAK